MAINRVNIKFSRNIRRRIEATQRELVAWLNKATGSDLLKAERLIARLKNLPTIIGRADESSAEFMALNASLRSAVVWPQVRGVWSGGAVTIGWATNKKISSNPALTEAVILAVALAEEGFVATILKCARCDRWIVAKKKDQRFCSEKCRNEFHMAGRNTEEYRAYMAKKMREYRAKEPSRRSMNR
jgi:endogenous inhibitor of DNA gyrase (YacG/DUF329 family)